MAADHTTVTRTIDSIWKIESARVIATLVRMVRDLSLAEDFAQDALLAALENWPANGIPGNPGAWLTATAKRRAIDHFRSSGLHARKQEELGADLAAREEDTVPEFTVNLDDASGDDLLRLMFIACHPVLATESRVALTLKLLGGLSTDEIARAFLVSESTVAQRIVRAKRALTEKRAAFEEPDAAMLADRLDAVLEVIYLVFNEGYAATRGADWLRPALCNDAIRLARVLAESMPRASEVQALLALMELQASRFNARTNAAGEPILLEDQDRKRWDRLLIRRGLAALDRARTLAHGIPGVYLLQAEIAACHARASESSETDWQRIAMLYGVLITLHPSPVLELNRAVAVCMSEGPQAALAIIEPLRTEPALASYHLLPGVRGDFLFRLGRHSEARSEFERAAALATNERERDFLLARMHDCTRH